MMGTTEEGAAAIQKRLRAAAAPALCARDVNSGFNALDHPLLWDCLGSPRRGFTANFADHFPCPPRPWTATLRFTVKKQIPIVNRKPRRCGWQSSVSNILKTSLTSEPRT